MWIWFKWLSWGLETGYWEHGNKHAGFIKKEEFYAFYEFYAFNLPHNNFDLVLLNLYRGLLPLSRLGPTPVFIELDNELIILTVYIYCVVNCPGYAAAAPRHVSSWHLSNIWKRLVSGKCRNEPDLLRTSVTHDSRQSHE